jgi:hypothetical protein
MENYFKIYFTNTDKKMLDKLFLGESQTFQIHLMNSQYQELYIKKGWELQLYYLQGEKAGALTTDSPDSIQFNINGLGARCTANEGLSSVKFQAQRDITLAVGDEIVITVDKLTVSSIPGVTYITFSYTETDSTDIVNQKVELIKTQRLTIDDFSVDGEIGGFGCKVTVKWNVIGSTEVYLDGALVESSGSETYTLDKEYELCLTCEDDNGQYIAKVLHLEPSGPVIKSLGFSQGHSKCTWEVQYADKVYINGNEVPASGETDTKYEGHQSCGGWGFFKYSAELVAVGYKDKRTKKYIEYEESRRPVI